MRVVHFILFYLAAVTLFHACDSKADELAVTCIYDGGDLIFASHVNSDQKELTRTFPTDEGTVLIRLTNLNQDFFATDLEFMENNRKTVKRARCAAERGK